jgi:UDP:flavonoid glycosyltransferase YjiC (YdhE family)
VVLAASGSHGDVHPFIAVALALKARGFEAAIATRPAFAHKIAAEGLGFFPLRADFEDVRARLGLGPDEIADILSDPRRGLAFMIRKLTLPFLREAFEDMMAATEGADLVVAGTTALAARLAAERRGLPWLSAVLQPLALMSAHDPPILGLAPWLDAVTPWLGPAGWRWALKIMRDRSEAWLGPWRELRRDLGLAAGPNPLFEGQFSPLGTLALYSPLLSRARPSFPPATWITGYCAYDSEAGGGGDLTPALARFLEDGPPPVVFTLGTAAALGAGDFFRWSAAAAARLGLRAVLVTGEDPRARPEGLGPDMIALPYAPYSRLFPKARAVVHHAGVGTAGEALRAGRPQLCVPFLVDQPDNAARLARLGVARIVPARARGAERLARELSVLLARPRYAERARELGEIARREDGAATATEVIARTLG